MNTTTTTSSASSTGAGSTRARLGRSAVLSAVAAGLAATAACGSIAGQSPGGDAPKPVTDQDKAQAAVDRYEAAFNEFASSGGRKLNGMELASRADVARAFNGLACDGFVKKVEQNFDMFENRRKVEPKMDTPTWKQVMDTRLDFAAPVLQGDHGRSESTLLQPDEAPMHGYINLTKLPNGQWQICPAGS